jgi:hypothetical protein
MNSNFFLTTTAPAAPSNALKPMLRLGSMATMFCLFASLVQATQVWQSNAAPETIEVEDVDGILQTKPHGTKADRNLFTQLNPFAANPPTTRVRAWISLPEQAGQSRDRLFQNQSRSLVAKAVGSAEGTRRPDGGTNRAYYGHVDPGNAVWNVGTFSYQHCGKCAPEEADRRQLKRLAGQFDRIQQYARQQYGLNLTLEEQLNAIDLANQAPLAALAQGGFIDRLQQAKDKGLRRSDAILQARVYAYKNPTTDRWEAPGLGNTLSSITHDQARRQEAIARAIQLHQ